MTFAFEDAADFDFAADAAILFAFDDELEEAVIDEDTVTDVDIVDEGRVVDADAADVVCGFDIVGHVEVESFAAFEDPFAVDVCGADFWAFDVHHDGDVSIEVVADFADSGDDGAGPVVGGVGHVEAADVDFVEDEFCEDVFAFCGGPDCEYYFSMSMSIIHGVI